MEQNIITMFLAALMSMFGMTGGAAVEDELTIEPMHSNYLSMTGTYRSLEGVMHELSCHCGNGGILTLDNGTEEGLCFDEYYDEVPQCEGEMMVWGSPVTSVREYDSQGVCPAGNYYMFEVDQAECL